jgi:hypothetical protein
VIALAKLGRFPLDLVERALMDKGEDRPPAPAVP